MVLRAGWQPARVAVGCPRLAPADAGRPQANVAVAVRVELACPEAPRWDPGRAPSCPGTRLPGRLRAPSCRPLRPPTQMAHPSSRSLPVGGIRDLLLGRGALGGAAGAAGELLHQGLSTASPQPVILFKQPCCLKGPACPHGYHEPHDCSWRAGRGQASRTQHPPAPRRATSVDGPRPVGPAPPPRPPLPAQDAGSHPLGWGQAGPFSEPPSGPWGWGSEGRECPVGEHTPTPDC